MIAGDRLLKTFVDEETRIGASGADLLDRVSPDNFTSVSGNDGCWATSLISSNSFAENSDSDEADIVVESASLPSDRLPPIDRQFFFELLAGARVGAFVGDDGNDLRDAGRVCRSVAVVAERNVRIDEIRHVWQWCEHDRQTVGSFFSVIFGRFSGRAGPGGGGVFARVQS